ncbi:MULTISPECIES: hypothetical protein [Bifidobacterium]|uniref:hypothetical protein n=1 Tax=Bifidobacterium TaxID=1678 RepID=UPI0018DB3235|nr:MULTISPECIES: hypothetical protein [Bifidobacterium]MBH9981095.1 hypothetical protein [Bifidobacterium asteroides]MBI0100361.1 hypothetical protein [Bifidobacterium sp. W8114]
MTSANNDPVLARLLQQVEERKAAVRALDKERDQLSQKARQMIRDAQDYERLYQEILKRHSWSKGTASRNGFRGVAAVITQCRKSVDEQAPEGSGDPQPAQGQAAAPAGSVQQEQSAMPEGGFLGQAEPVI